MLLLLLVVVVGMGDMAASASQGIVGIFSSALPSITCAGALEMPSCSSSTR